MIRICMQKWEQCNDGLGMYNVNNNSDNMGGTALAGGHDMMWMMIIWDTIIR